MNERQKRNYRFLCKFKYLISSFLQIKQFQLSFFKNCTNMIRRIRNINKKKRNFCFQKKNKFTITYRKSLMSASSSYYKFDICNPFNPDYPKPLIYQNYCMVESPSLNRDLVKKKNLFDDRIDNLQQMRQQLSLLNKKQSQYHELLYSNSTNFNSLGNQTIYSNLQQTPRYHFISSNPFLSGEPLSITQLKQRHVNAKMEFTSRYERQLALRMNEIDYKQEQELRLRKALENKEFKSLMELKNLQQYRKIKCVEKLVQQRQLMQQRKSLMNVQIPQPNCQNNRGVTSLYFGNDTFSAKKVGTKNLISSRFANSEAKPMENILEQENDDMRITFNAKRQTLNTQQEKVIREIKRPNILKKSSDDKRNSLSNIKVSGVDSPKTIKLKNKTFYLIAA